MSFNLTSEQDESSEGNRSENGLQYPAHNEQLAVWWNSLDENKKRAEAARMLREINSERQTDTEDFYPFNESIETRIQRLGAVYGSAGQEVVQYVFDAHNGSLFEDIV